MAKSQNNEIANLIKEICRNVINAEKPSTFLYGTVVSVLPLKVQISENIILTSNFLKVPQWLTDFNIDVSMTNWSTESSSTEHTHTIELNDRYNATGDTEAKSIVSSGQSTKNTHTHSIRGTKSITIHNGLKVGDKVYLGRFYGGQDFIILDRVVV